MTLGELIDTLAALPQVANVSTDLDTIPVGLCSWRGAYGQLTLDHEERGRHIKPRTVAQLLSDARSADGREFEGGMYVMDLSTPIWADEYGAYHKRIITGLVVKHGEVIVQTFELPYAYI